LPGLTIPPEQLPALQKIRAMSAESLESFAAALSTSPRTAAIPDLSSDDSESIRKTLTELYKVRSYFDVELSKFVTDIVDALQGSFPTEQADTFKASLTRLLAIDSLNVEAKAFSLKGEYEHAFCTARILTDARPIYGVDPSGAPAAMMIIHTLRVSYHDESSRLREIYIAMDQDDVTAMKEALDRADVKFKSLKNVFAAANIRVIDSEER